MTDPIAIAAQIIGDLHPNEKRYRSHRFLSQVALPLQYGGFGARECVEDVVAPWRVMLAAPLHRTPEGQEAATVAEMQAEQFAVFRRIMDVCRRRGAVSGLAGVRGSGKTTVAAMVAAWRHWDVALADLWTERRTPVPRYSAFYRKLGDIAARLKPLYLPMGSTDMERLEAERERITGGDLLVLDETNDVTKERELCHLVMTDLGDRCYRNLTDLILISNLDPEHMSESIGTSLLSRMNQHSGIIPCNWGSFRDL